MLHGGAGVPDRQRKFAHAVEHVHHIPFYVEMAVRNSIYSRPGASYLDMADDIITGKGDEATVEEPARCPDPPRTQAMPEDVERSLDVLRSSSAPRCRSSPRRRARGSCPTATRCR